MDLEINSSFISPKLPNTLNYYLWVYKYVIHLVYRMNISRCVIAKQRIEGYMLELRNMLSRGEIK